MQHNASTKANAYSSISFIVLQDTAAAAPDLSTVFLFFYSVLAGFIATIANSGTANRHEPTSILFLKKNYRFQLKRKACTKQEVSSRFTLLLTLHPGLGGYSNISFVGLQGAKTPIPKPDCSEHDCNGVKRKAGPKASKNHKPLIFKK